MTVSETPTPEQIAACERAMDGLEAQADIWADEINLVVMVKQLGGVARGLTDRMPTDIREGFIHRIEAQIDAIARQAYLEGFDRGGESRKAYDEATLTAALSDQAGGWQDISTAPKDGTPVLLSGVRAGRRWMMDGAIYALGWIGGSSVGSSPDCWRTLPAPPPSSTPGGSQSG